MVHSGGGAAEGGVVTEGMGYGILVEGVQAAHGDKEALATGLGLLKGWLGMVQGPKGPSLPWANHTSRPLGGGDGKNDDSATKVDTQPYGVSVVAPSGPAAKGPSGMAAWKFPIANCSWGLCTGSATDGDEDALFGMIYLAEALGHPEDFTDTVIRSVISLASADLGFPDLYRTLPDGTKLFVAKGGSAWGGLLPEHGAHKTGFLPWCYNPSYFAPAHYRLFRDYAKKHWKPSFDEYLPPHLDGKPSTLAELVESFDGAVTAGYNIMYRSTCESGSVANWVGVEAVCKSDPSSLNCPGVPWSTTPFVGKDGKCAASGTGWGSWGSDACRAPWRIAMDYVLYTEESAGLVMYDEQGKPDKKINFNAKVYLNRLAGQYARHSKCDGSSPGECHGSDGSGKENVTDGDQLAYAFMVDHGAEDITCHNVPTKPHPSWKHAHMSHPTFTGFVAPLKLLTAAQSSAWLDTLSQLCDYSNMSSVNAGLCATGYFDAGQQVISSMVMSGSLKLPWELSA